MEKYISLFADNIKEWCTGRTRKIEVGSQRHSFEKVYQISQTKKTQGKERDNPNSKGDTKMQVKLHENTKI